MFPISCIRCFQLASSRIIKKRLPSSGAIARPIPFKNDNVGNARTSVVARFFSTTDNSSDDKETSSSSSSKSSHGKSQKAQLANILFKNPIVHQLWMARQEAKAKLREREESDHKREKTSSCPPLPADSDGGKTPCQSRVEISYPFSTDLLLVEAYRNPWGRVRLGRILEDIDALAGNIAYFHCESDDPTAAAAAAEHPVIVTASVDRIRLDRQQPDLCNDQHLSGQVTWTGTSSMEIRMQCMDAGTNNIWLEAFVTYVTLDPHTKKPMRIPPIRPQSDQEKQFFEEGSARAALKKKVRQRKKHRASSSSSPSQGPTGEDEKFDIAFMDEMAQKYLAEAGPLLNMPSLADPHSILMSQTKMQNALIAQPQVQNLHKRIFGGFLMRRAFELAYSNAYMFGGARPISKDVDEVTFASPVSVGDLLIFNSRVVYTENIDDDRASLEQQKTEGKALPLIHVEVEAWVSEPEKVMARLSNQFYFTFAVDLDERSDTDSSRENNSRIRRVLPSNIDEARRMALRVLIDREKRDT